MTKVRFSIIFGAKSRLSCLASIIRASEPVPIVRCNSKSLIWARFTDSWAYLISNSRLACSRVFSLPADIYIYMNKQKSFFTVTSIFVCFTFNSFRRFLFFLSLLYIMIILETSRWRRRFETKWSLLHFMISATKINECVLIH